MGTGSLGGMRAAMKRRRRKRKKRMTRMLILTKNPLRRWRARSQVLSRLYRFRLSGLCVPVVQGVL
jgi:hypothetical protein